MKVRAISKFSEIDTTKFYQLYTGMSPAAAASAYQARYGVEPSEILTYGDGDFVYIQTPTRAGVWGGRDK